MNRRRVTRQWQASEEQEYPSELHSEVPGKQTLPHAHVARVKAMLIAAINRNPRDTQTKTFDIQAGLRWVLKKMLAGQPCLSATLHRALPYGRLRGFCPE